MITYFPWRPASSISFLYSSFRSFNLFLFSLLSSSARSFTYLSKTCFRSLDVNSKYRGSNTILCSSFSHVLNAETYKPYCIIITEYWNYKHWHMYFLGLFMSDIYCCLQFYKAHWWYTKYTVGKWFNLFNIKQLTHN